MSSPSTPAALPLPLKPLLQGVGPGPREKQPHLFPPSTSEHAHLLRQPSFSPRPQAPRAAVLLVAGSRTASGSAGYPDFCWLISSPRGPLAASVLPQVLTPVQSQVRLQATRLKTQRPPPSPGHSPRSALEGGSTLQQRPYSWDQQLSPALHGSLCWAFTTSPSRTGLGRHTRAHSSRKELSLGQSQAIRKHCDQQTTERRKCWGPHRRGSQPSQEPEKPS